MLTQTAKHVLRRIDIEQMEVPVDLERLLQSSARLIRLSECLSDHPVVKEKQRIPRPVLNSFLAGFGGLFQLAVFIQSPRQRIPGVDVMADFQLLLRQI